MRNIAILFYIILFISVGCDKQKQTARQISGTWEIKSYKKTDIEGLSEFANCSGEMTFGKCKGETSCTYSTNFSFTFPDTSGTNTDKGTFQVIEKGDYMNLTVTDNSNNVIDTLQYRILIRTKTDLSLEHNKGNGITHTYVFTKK